MNDVPELLSNPEVLETLWLPWQVPLARFILIPLSSLQHPFCYSVSATSHYLVATRKRDRNGWHTV